MDHFDKEFLMEMFLDNDSVSTVNRLVVAVANVVHENSENVVKFSEVMKKEHPQVLDTRSVDLGKHSPSRKRKKIHYDRNVLDFTEEDYLEKFNMKKSTVQTLINYLKDLAKPGAMIVPLETKVHVFLWLLTSDSSYGEIGSLFSLHKSSVAYIFHEIAALLAEQRYNFISWPSIEEQHITRIKVNSRFQFPNCVGFIDACRFKAGSKKNKKEKQDILLQAVCDESLAFIDIHIGDIGVTKKSRVYKDSHLGQELKNFVHFDNHILGDSEYRLRKNLITPFSSEELLTTEEMKFNEIHWRARSYIGHAFELLKERFRKLNYMDINKPESINTLICAACVLHNFVLLHEGCPSLKEEPVTCEDGVTIDTDVVKTADEKRQFLCNYVNYLIADTT